MNTTSTTAAGTPSPYSHPTQLPELPAGWPVAVDCETGHLNPGGSALWADSGARLSAISVAWVDPQVVTDPDPDRLWHAVQTGDGVHSVAYPFSQGDHIGPDLDQVKPGAKPDLFNYQDNPNLGPDAYLALFSWLTRNTPRLVFHNGKFDLNVLRYWPLGWREGTERCPIHDSLVSWGKPRPADEATWSQSVMQMACANNVNTRTTEPADQSRGGGSASSAGSRSSSTTEAAARAAARRGSHSSSSTTSTATELLTEPRFAMENTETGQAILPTGGLLRTGIPRGSKYYAQTATRLRSVLRGAHPDTDCTCVLDGVLPDLEKLRHEPLGWDAGIGVDLLFDRTFWDTQVVCPIVWPREPVTSLKPTAARLWGESETAERDALAPYLGPKTDPQYDRVPWSVIGPYAAKDAAQTIRLFYQQRAELGVWRDRGALDPIRLLQAYREIEVMRVLYRMERAGVPFDAGSSRRIAAELATRRAHLDAGLPFKPTPAAAGRWFFTDQVLPRPGGGTTTGVGLLPYQMTATGRPSMTAEITNRLVQDLDPDTEPGRAAAALAERSKLDTAIKMWYGPYADGVGSDGRLRTCFRQVARGRGDQEGGTRSGRFSVERVNLQAIPHDYRLVAGTDRTWPVATPRQLIGQAAAGLAGWQLWEFDLQQAELRVAAAYARCEPMLEAMRHGRDLHGETTSKLFQLGPDDPRWSFYRQLGKRALPVETPVLTPAGWKPIGRLRVGDEVVGKDGSTIHVTAIPFEGTGNLWEVVTRSGVRTVCDEDHLWTVNTRYGERTMDTKTLGAQWKQLRAKPLTYGDIKRPDLDLPLHPYVLGAMLGDGSSYLRGKGAPRLHSAVADRDIAYRCGELTGDLVRMVPKPDQEHLARFHFLGGRVRDGLDAAGVLGVCGHSKTIPEQYLFGSRQQRLDLLRGLMDTDGCVSGNRVIFNNTSRALVDGVVALVRSLGGVASVSESYRDPAKRWKPSWRVNLRLDDNPFWLARKATKWRAPRVQETLASVAPLNIAGAVRCISVSAPDGLFVIGDYQITHNSNFSLGFGAGGKTFGGMVAKETGHILSVDEAGRIVEDWNLLYPQFRRAIERWSRFVEEHRALPLASVAGFATGRLRVFRKAEDEHKAFNQLVQASLAEFMRDWLIGAQRVCDEAGLGLVPGVGWTGLLLTIHDSLVLLLPDDRADELAARVVGVAVDLWGRYFGRGDPLWRVAGVDGGVDAKRWG